MHFVISLMPAEGGRKYGKGEGGGKNGEGGKGRGKGGRLRAGARTLLLICHLSRSFVLPGQVNPTVNLYNFFMDSLQLPYEVSARIQSNT